MGLADRDYFQEDSYAKERRVRRHRSITALIIIANVAIFLLDHSTGGALTRYMCLAGSVADQPSQWYRCLTYGFVHDSSGFMHIFCNMLTLFFFGPPLERLYGRKEFLIFYLGSIFFAGIVWNVLHVDARAIAIGASGGIAAVVVLFACKFPRNIVLLYGVIPLPVWLLGVLYSGFLGGYWTCQDYMVFMASEKVPTKIRGSVLGGLNLLQYIGIFGGMFFLTIAEIFISDQWIGIACAISAIPGMIVGMILILLHSKETKGTNFEELDQAEEAEELA